MRKYSRRRAAVLGGNKGQNSLCLTRRLSHLMLAYSRFQSGFSRHVDQGFPVGYCTVPVSVCGGSSETP